MNVLEGWNIAKGRIVADPEPETEIGDGFDVRRQSRVQLITRPGVEQLYWLRSTHQPLQQVVFDRREKMPVIPVADRP